MISIEYELMTMIKNILLLCFLLSLTSIHAAEDKNMDNSSNCDINSIQQALLTAHNKARAKARRCGQQKFSAAPELEWSCTLADITTAHANDMATKNYIEHQRADGTSARDDLIAARYEVAMWAENIGAGQEQVKDVVKGWLKSPGHCSNIMNPDITKMGGSRIDSSTAQYPYYWSVLFAKPLR